MARGKKPKTPDLTIVGGGRYVKNEDRALIESRPKKKKFPFRAPKSFSAREKKDFLWIEAALAPRGTYTEHDADGIFGLIRAKTFMLELEAQIDENGIMIEQDEEVTEYADGRTVTKKKAPKLNPAVTHMDKARARYMNLLYEFGLTPLGRIKHGISPDGGPPAEEEQNKDPASKYF